VNIKDIVKSVTLSAGFPRNMFTINILDVSGSKNGDKRVFLLHYLLI